MKHSNPSSASNGGSVGIVLEEFITVSPKTHAFRQTITKTAWNKLSPREQASLKEVTHMIAGEDKDLSAAYAEAVLVVHHMHQNANINTDPNVLLPEEDYRFWY